MDNYDALIQARTQMLKARSQRCVCKYCGSPLRLRRIIFSDLDDARIEMFCTACDRIEFGIEPEIYASAKAFIEESRFNCFPDMDENATTRQMNIAKISEIISWGQQSIGILGTEGYCVPISSADHFLGECLTLDDDDIAAYTQSFSDKQAGGSHD